MNKKLIFAVISVLILLIIVTVSISAFQVDNSYTVVYDQPSRNAVQNMIDVFYKQQSLGFISSDFSIISISYDNDVGATILLASKSPSSISVSSGSLRNYSGPDKSLIPYVWTNSGWSYPFLGRQPTNLYSVYPQFHYYSSITVSAVGSYSGFTGLNPNSVFGSSDSSSSSVLSYYTTYSDRLFGYDSAVSEAYSEGLATGQGEGYQVGLEEGYNQGYDIGYDYGHDRGYSEGQTEGYSEGYSEGFDFGVENGYRQGYDEGEEEGYSEGYSEGESVGYSSGHLQGFDEGREEGYTFGFDNGYSEGYTEGYSEGYETGYQSGLDDVDSSEPLQTFKAYIFRFDENNVLQYSWYNETFGLFAWVDYNSHFDPTKRPYTFIVRLTESDLNNSSTQIELPFDFISSPGNRDYSVASFDPEFLTGYGNSLSLFVNKSRSYDNGYNVGLQDGADLLDGISDISAKPIGALRDALDFELFGVNIGLVAIALVSVLIVFAAYKFVKKIFPI